MHFPAWPIGLPTWEVQVRWHSTSLMPLAILCCEHEYALWNEEAQAIPEDEVEAIVEHTWTVHHIPHAVMVRLILSLPELGIRVAMGLEDDDDA